ncbi:MAG: hypothetical protein U0941_30815 [Planctomycetaceae bacterium]
MRDTLRRQELSQRQAVNRDRSGLIAMTEFLATLQVAYRAPSVSTGLKALCFVLVGFQPTNSPPHKPPMIATSPPNRDKDLGNDDSTLHPFQLKKVLALRFRGSEPRIRTYSIQHL